MTFLSDAGKFGQYQYVIKLIVITTYSFRGAYTSVPMAVWLLNIDDVLVSTQYVALTYQLPSLRVANESTAEQ